MSVFQGRERSCGGIGGRGSGHQAGFVVGGGGREAPGSPVDTALCCRSAGTGKQVNNLSCFETGNSNRPSLEIELQVRLP